LAIELYAKILIFFMDFTQIFLIQILQVAKGRWCGPGRLLDGHSLPGQDGPGENAQKGPYSFLSPI